MKVSTPLTLKTTPLSPRIMVREMAYLLGQLEYPHVSFTRNSTLSINVRDPYLSLNEFSRAFLEPIARGFVRTEPTRAMKLAAPSGYDEMHASSDGMTVFITTKPSGTIQNQVEINFCVTYLCPPERLALPKELAELAEMYELS